MFEIIATSFAVVALAEIGDKTMLLAIVLAARFRKPLPIALGILGATIANHLVAAFAGAGIMAGEGTDGGAGGVLMSPSAARFSSTGLMCARS